MTQRRPGPRRVRGVAVSALVLAFAGCADEPVSISSPDVSSSVRITCQQFLADLPTHLAGEQKRALARNGALGAAWGDPPIILTCGGEPPDDFDRFAECVEANGVGWFVPAGAEDDQSSSAVVTAAGYRPVVRVRVPGDYRPEGVASVMAQLAEPVREHLRLIDRCE
jgi:Protein of unknown function (DUF3515)